ncbi:hypothetical protein YC2023_010505 [Brassica napus]
MNSSGNKSSLDVEFSIFSGSFAGGGAAVFPALGQDSFRGTTPTELDEYSKALYPPSYQAYIGFHYHLDSRTWRERWFSSYLLVVAWCAYGVPRKSSFDSPAYVTYQSCEPDRKVLCAASEPFIFSMGRSYEPGRIGGTRDQLDPRNVEAGFEVVTWSRGEPNIIEGRFQAGTGSRQGPGTVEVILEEWSLSQQEPKTVETWNRSNQMRLRRDSKLEPGTCRDPVLVLVSTYATTVSMVLYFLREVFWDLSCASFRSDESKSFHAPSWLGLRDFQEDTRNVPPTYHIVT